MEKLFLALCGSGMAIWGLCLLWMRLSLFFTGNKTSGKVIEWVPWGRKRFHPVVSFTAEDGQEYKFTSYTGFSWRPKIDRYPVIYPNAQPSKAVVYTLVHFWLPPLMILALSTAPFFIILRTSL
jgi:hypothetical protein